MSYGVIDMSRLSTEPGAAGPLAPPEGWTRGGDAYRALLLQRWSDPGFAQQLTVAARFRRDVGREAAIEGSHAAAAVAVLSDLPQRPAA